MSLSTALMPQPRENFKIFARFLEQRHGYWNYMKHRNISLSTKINTTITKTVTIVEQQEGEAIVRCGNSLQIQRSSGLMTLQRQQMLTGALSSKEDYRIYPQSVDLDAFFGAEQRKCEKVSDICLLNDHFMLVKMPNNELKSDCQLAMSTPAELHPQKVGYRLPRCFKCNRGSRVSPILEEREDVIAQQITPWTNDDNDDDADADADVEVFDSRTRIIPIHKQQQHQQQQFQQANNSLPNSVIIKQPRAERNPVIPNWQLEVEQAPTLPVESNYQDAKISRGPLHWFLWPFRLRSSNKSKVPLAAAVHKTYFVRWHKPPDTLWHGYGVERAVGNKVELRRCRSAIF